MKKRTFLKSILGALLAPSAVLVTPAAATPMSKLSGLAADFDGDSLNPFDIDSYSEFDPEPIRYSDSPFFKLNQNGRHGAYAPINVQFYKKVN